MLVDHIQPQGRPFYKFHRRHIELVNPAGQRGQMEADQSHIVVIRHPAKRAVIFPHPGAGDNRFNVG
ncbi:hypothetical protein D3C71_1298950 [compost metagenome]